MVDGRKVTLLEDIHNLVRDTKCLVLQPAKCQSQVLNAGRKPINRDNLRCIPGKRVDKLAQCLKVPEETPRRHVRHDEVRGREREKAVRVRGLDGIAIPRNTEHTVAARLDDELVCALRARLGRNDVLNAAVATVPASDPCGRQFPWEGGASGRGRYLAGACHPRCISWPRIRGRIRLHKRKYIWKYRS